jgi:hypothetical protein
MMAYTYVYANSLEITHATECIGETILALHELCAHILGSSAISASGGFMKRTSEFKLPLGFLAIDVYEALKRIQTSM